MEQVLDSASFTLGSISSTDDIIAVKNPPDIFIEEEDVIPIRIVREQLNKCRELYKTEYHKDIADNIRYYNQAIAFNNGIRSCIKIIENSIEEFKKQYES